MAEHKDVRVNDDYESKRWPGGYGSGLPVTDCLARPTIRLACSAARKYT
jgi:hypothetical protein